MNTGVAALRAENQQLRSELHELLDQAHINQQIMQRHQAFDLRLIASSGFRELIETVSLTMADTFNLEVVTLTLIDSDHAIRRILHELQIGLDEFPNLLFLDALPDNAAQPVRPALGVYQAQQHQFMFPTYRPASVALLPLSRQHALIGYLALGSAHQERFSQQLATDFIERLASIVAICLENVINNERLKHIGLTDQLTGVNNRRYLEQRMQEEISRAQRDRSALSCLFIDIDHFKRVNDSFGHQCGDDVLREVASRIKQELRLSDSLGRFGGEEFVVLLTQATLQDAARIGERIRASVAQQQIRLSGNDEVLQITVSIGVASLMPPERNINATAAKQALLKQADDALYRAKESGRNRVMLAEPLVSA